MLFRFSSDLWLGVHLGMTGKMSSAGAEYEPEKHDHLVLDQGGRALIFNDLRQFGRIKFHQGKEAPAWWAGLAPAIASKDFSLEVHEPIFATASEIADQTNAFVAGRLPRCVGNWMADEILWRAKIS